LAIARVCSGVIPALGAFAGSVFPHPDNVAI
jgi:hypothetical protein